MMINLFSYPDNLRRNTNDFHEISFSSDFSTESYNYMKDLRNSPDDFYLINNNNNNISFLNIQENKLFEKEINEKDNFNINLENIYFIGDSENKQISGKSNLFKFVLKKENLEDIENNDLIYRKDAYYKHFKAIFAKYIKDKANKLKNICFPNFSKNNFFPLSYKYTGNPKEKDNFKFLSYTIKELLSYGKNEKIKNRQYNNELLIKYIEDNKTNAKDKKVYLELINFFNISVEKELINFYNNEKEQENINKDSRCLFYDKHFKKETGISLLNKYGFIWILNKQNK